jgi:hypothetical protein
LMDWLFKIKGDELAQIRIDLKGYLSQSDKAFPLLTSHLRSM